MPEIEIGPSDGGGGGVGGIPRKWLLIGAGGIGLAAFFLWQRSAGGGAGGGEGGANGTYSGQLGPNAAVALGSLQTDLRQQSGLLQHQLADYFADVNTTLGGIGAAGASSLDLLGGLSDDVQAGFAAQQQGLTGALGTITSGFGQVGAALQNSLLRQEEWGQLLAAMTQQSQDLQRHYGEYVRTRLVYDLPFTSDPTVREPINSQIP